jgi:hypothetical protein
MINRRHKGTLFLIQVSDSTTRDPIQGIMILGFLL